MKRFQKLYSITILLFAFIYPPAIAEAKVSNVDNVLQPQNVELETNLVEVDTNTSPELLLAHNHRRHYRRRRRTQHHYNRRRRNHRHYNRRNRHQRIRRIHYRGPYYRRGRWELVRDRHGRLMYDWRRY